MIVSARSGGLGPSKAAASTIVYERLRQDIVEGALMPGAKLAIEAVAARYGTGANPVREALNRLAAEGLVARRDQRGFFVAALTLEKLGELVKTRRWLEAKALAESMQGRTPAWEEAVVLSYHHLARTPQRIERDGEAAINPEWERRHRAFHMALIAGCGSSWLLDFCGMLMDQSVRYRNVAANFSRRGDGLAEHREIMEAALDGTVAEAVARLDAHYRLTFEALERLFGEAAGRGA